MGPTTKSPPMATVSEARLPERRSASFSLRIMDIAAPSRPCSSVPATSLQRRRATTSGGTIRALGFRQPAFDALYAVRIARMVAEELGRLLAFRRPLHALPERQGLARVVSRPGHVDEPDVIRLRLLRPAER